MSYNSIPQLATDSNNNLKVSVANYVSPVSSSFSFNSLNQSSSYSASNIGATTVNITNVGTYGVVAFQGSSNGGLTYSPIFGVPLSGGPSVISTEITGIWRFNLVGLTNIQILCTQAPTSGSITGYIVGDNNQGVVSVDNIPSTQNTVPSSIITPASNFNIQYSGSTSGSAVTVQIQPGGLYSIATALPSLAYPNASFAGGITLYNGSPSASFGGQSGLFVGQVVLGNNIPASAYIKLLGSSSLVLSANATGNVTGSNNEVIQGLSLTGATPASTAFGATGTSGNNFITMPAGFVAPFWMGPGTYIQGAAGIPALTAITSISGTQINLSANLNANVLVTTLITFTTNTFYDVTGTSGNNFITFPGTPPPSIQPGQNIVGSVGIPANTYITSISGSQVNLSANLTANVLVGTTITVNFNYYFGATANYTSPVGQNVLVWSSLTSIGGISVGQVVGGTGIAPGTYVVAVGNNTVTLSLPVNAAITATTSISFNAGNFTGVFEASVDNQVWNSVNVIPKTVIGNNAPVSSTNTIGLFTFQDQTNTYNYLRFRITALNSIPYVSAWIDALVPNKVIHLPYIVGVAASTTAFTIPTGCGFIPPIECSDISEINLDITAFTGTAQSLTWYESGDPLLNFPQGCAGASIGGATWSWGISAAATGQYKICPHAPYFVTKLTFTAVSPFTIGSVTARIGPVIQQDSTNVTSVGNLSVNLASLAASTPATATAVTNKLLGTAPGITAGSTTAFLTSQTGKATQAAPYASALTTSDFGIFADMYLMITAATTGTAAVVSSISTTTGVVTTSTPHGYQIGQVLTFSAITATGLSITTPYYVTANNYTTTTFTLSANPGGPVIIPTAFTSATLTTSGIAKVVIQDTNDAGTSYFDVYHSEYFWFGVNPTTQKMLMKNIPLTSGKPQALVYLWSGVTPNTPTAISYQIGGSYRPNGDAFTRQFVDYASLNPNISTVYPLLSSWTAGGNTAAGTNLATNWKYDGCKNFTLNIASSYYYTSMSVAPVYGVRFSQDGWNWWDSGTSLTVNSGSTAFGTVLSNTGPVAYAQPYIKTAGSGSAPSIASAATTTLTFSTPHGLSPGQVVMFSNVGSLTNVSLNTYYYVLASNWTATVISIAANFGTAGAISVGTTVGSAAIYPCSQLYASLKGQS